MPAQLHTTPAPARWWRKPPTPPPPPTARAAPSSSHSATPRGRARVRACARAARRELSGRARRARANCLAARRLAGARARGARPLAGGARCKKPWPRPRPPGGSSGATSRGPHSCDSDSRAVARPANHSPAPGHPRPVHRHMRRVPPGACSVRERDRRARAGLRAAAGAGGKGATCLRGLGRGRLAVFFCCLRERWRCCCMRQVQASFVFCFAAGNGGGGRRAGRWH